jgi:hypothetical protein
MNQRGIARATFRPVAETLSTPEVAHAIGHHHGKTRGEKHAERVEILEAILLAVVAVATAWSGYQTARWDGRQAHLYGLSSKARAAENRASTLSGQQRLYDTSTFGFWLQEKAQGDHEAAALFERRFRPEYRRAFTPWLRTDPLHNPRAPVGPIFMPQYRNAAAGRALLRGHLSNCLRTIHPLGMTGGPANLRSLVSWPLNPTETAGARASSSLAAASPESVLPTS